jgi:anion-transporting  ArsA/GET3 family ATPase
MQSFVEKLTRRNKSQPEKPVEQRPVSVAAQIEALQERLKAAQAQQRKKETALAAADQTVAQLTAQAAAGTLRNPQALADALRQRQQLQDAPRVDIAALQAEIDALQDKRHQEAREAAQRAYLDAISDYAAAAGAADLPSLAARVRELAPGAGVQLMRCPACGHDGMHAQSTFIGGAEIALKL